MYKGFLQNKTFTNISTEYWQNVRTVLLPFDASEAIGVSILVLCRTTKGE